MLVSKPCSEATDIGYIFSGGSGCFNPANLLKDLGKKSGEIEVIRVNPSKNSYNERYNLLERPQIPPTINSNSIPSQNTAPEESLLCLRQIPIFVTLLLYILIPPVKKNNTSVMVLPQQKYYNKIIRNVVQKIAFKAH